MSRIQQAMTRALKATAADLTEIVKIGGLSNQDRYILRRASEICTGLMDKPMASRLANEKQSQNATNGRSAEPSNDKPSAGPHNQEAGNAGQGGGEQCVGAGKVAGKLGYLPLHGQPGLQVGIGPHAGGIHGGDDGIPLWLCAVDGPLQRGALRGQDAAG